MTKVLSMRRNIIFPKGWNVSGIDFHVERRFIGVCTSVWAVKIGSMQFEGSTCHGVVVGHNTRYTLRGKRIRCLALEVPVCIAFSIKMHRGGVYITVVDVTTRNTLQGKRIRCLALEVLACVAERIDFSNFRSYCCISWWYTFIVCRRDPETPTRVSEFAVPASKWRGRTLVVARDPMDNATFVLVDSMLGVTIHKNGEKREGISDGRVGAAVERVAQRLEALLARRVSHLQRDELVVVLDLLGHKVGTGADRCLVVLGELLRHVLVQQRGFPQVWNSSTGAPAGWQLWRHIQSFSNHDRW